MDGELTWAPRKERPRHALGRIDGNAPWDGAAMAKVLSFNDSGHSSLNSSFDDDHDGAAHGGRGGGVLLPLGVWDAQPAVPVAAVPAAGASKRGREDDVFNFSELLSSLTDVQRAAVPVNSMKRRKVTAPQGGIATATVVHVYADPSAAAGHPTPAPAAPPSGASPSPTHRASFLPPPRFDGARATAFSRAERRGVPKTLSASTTPPPLHHPSIHHPTPTPPPKDESPPDPGPVVHRVPWCPPPQLPVWQ